MRIRMVQERTGPRWDGRAWPPAGGEIELDDDEGAAVCGSGWAVPVAVTGEPVQTPEAPLDARTETRDSAPAHEPAQPRPAPPAPNEPKAAWIAYAVAQGYDHDEAAAMTKADLIAALGQDG